MMSASEGGGVSWKRGRSKGGCVNFMLQISSKCGQGGEEGVKKSENFADVINGCSLNTTFRPEEDCRQQLCSSSLLGVGVPVADLSVVGVPSGVAASEPEEALADVAGEDGEDEEEEEERRLSFSEVTEDDSEVNRFGGPGLILRWEGERFP